MDVIYTDLHSAFDFVSHELLCCKLSAFGFCEVASRLLNSYLTNRINYVRVNYYSSSEYVSYSGVPQGSNLGLLLFVLVLDDLFRSMDCPVFAYADDIKLLLPVSSIADVAHFQRNLDVFMNW